MGSFWKIDRRRQLVVDPAGQRKITTSVALPMLAILFAVLCIQMVLDYNLRRGTLDVDGTILGMPERSVSAVLFFLFATAYQLVHALRVSNRISGAAYNVRKTLNAYKQGDRSARVVLRKGDLTFEVAEDVNALLDWFETTRGADKTGAAKSEPGRPERSRPSNPQAVTPRS